MKKFLPYLFLSAAVLLTMIFFLRSIEIAYEKFMIHVFPSAERAFSYGERHFDAQSPHEYDIHAAESFFHNAEQIDSSYPYLNHELARIYFLKGDFDTAMLYINKQIYLYGETAPNSFYIRGLVEGFQGDYDAAVRDYKKYLSLLKTPNWAGINDYAWVLIKAKKTQEAESVTEDALKIFPKNPWLMNSNAIAKFENGKLSEAIEEFKKVQPLVESLTEHDWLISYPGNDPRSASQGLATFRTSVADNMHRVEEAIASSTVH